MPELPEVNTKKLNFDRVALNKKIEKAELRETNHICKKQEPDASNCEQPIANREQPIANCEPPIANREPPPLTSPDTNPHTNHPEKSAAYCRS